MEKRAAKRPSPTKRAPRAPRAEKPKTVKISFVLPAEVSASDVALCGDFNNWQRDDIKLVRDGTGQWHTDVPLEPGRAYRYRYLLDGQRWENAWDADRYVPNPYGEDDSVVVLE